MCPAGWVGSKDCICICKKKLLHFLRAVGWHIVHVICAECSLPETFQTFQTVKPSDLTS